jgi:hypothetical protein
VCQKCVMRCCHRRQRTEGHCCQRCVAFYLGPSADLLVEARLSAADRVAGSAWTRQRNQSRSA